MIKSQTKSKRPITIIRSPKDKDHPYLMVSKQLIKNKKLSWKAKGILMYLLSLPDIWEIYLSEIRTHSKGGMSSFMSGIHELQENKYLLRKTIRKHGKIVRNLYLVRENPERGFLIVENLIVENRMLLNTDISKERSLNHIVGGEAPADTDSNNKNIFGKLSKKASPSKNDIRRSKTLQDIILTKKNVKMNITGWPEIFRKLRQINEVSPERIKQVLKWYTKNIGGEFVPVAYSAQSFREKFTRIEDAMNRHDQDKKKKRHEDGEYVNSVKTRILKDGTEEVTLGYDNPYNGLYDQ